MPLDSKSAVGQVSPFPRRKEAHAERRAIEAFYYVTLFRKKKFSGLDIYLSNFTWLFSLFGDLQGI